MCLCVNILLAAWVPHRRIRTSPGTRAISPEVPEIRDHSSLILYQLERNKPESSKSRPFPDQNFARTTIFFWIFKAFPHKDFCIARSSETVVRKVLEVNWKLQWTGIRCRNDEAGLRGCAKCTCCGGAFFSFSLSCDHKQTMSFVFLLLLSSELPHQNHQLLTGSEKETQAAQAVRQEEPTGLTIRKWLLFPKPKLLLIKFRGEQIFSSSESSNFGLSDWETRRGSGARRSKRQTIQRRAQLQKLGSRRPGQIVCLYNFRLRQTAAKPFTRLLFTRLLRFRNRF